VIPRPARALVLLVALAAPVFADETVSLREVRQGLFGTCFVTDRVGWMVGELGRIFHTTDGGATWQRQAVDTKRPFLAISCVDEKTAWIAGKEGIVYATRDGGTTWTFSKTGSTRHIFALQFPTALRGHGAGDFGSMVHTEDGGGTWTVSQVPTDVRLPESALDIGVEPGDVNLYAISYGDADHAWLVGEFGIVLASDDGGQTWHQQQAPIESTLFGVHFIDAQHGWAVGIDSMILVTRDGGATWTPQRSPLARRSYYDVFVRGDRGWIVGSSGTVLHSADAGETWAVQPLPIELAANWIRSVWVAPGGAGLAVGAEGLVFRIDGDAFERLGARQEQL
jgi:photosystem II stability/assembly factor-like uncharacterized protein